MTIQFIEPCTNLVKYKGNVPRLPHQHMGISNKFQAPILHLST